MLINRPTKKVWQSNVQKILVPRQPKKFLSLRIVIAALNVSTASFSPNLPTDGGGGSNTGVVVQQQGSEDLSSIQCHLETKELWDKFNELGTEMIITKSGR